MKRIGIVGFGIMGSAFAAGFAKKLPGASILAYDVKRERVDVEARERRLVAAESASEVFVQSDITILCVKPQDFAAFSAALPKEARGKQVISRLAGTKIQAISAGLGTDQVARFMPSLAAVKGASLVGVAFHAAATPQMRQDSLSIATALGAPLEIQGAAAMLRDGAHPMELASRVISPAGTTIQGLQALERGGFTAAVMEAVEAAARRATELEG
jgi:pyrroline-5-carboxylate reductase